MTTPNPNDNGWSANKWLPTGNKPDGSGLAGFSTRDKNGWGNGILGIFGDSAPKSQAITQGLFTNWLGAAGNPNDPLLNPQADKNLILNGGFEASVGWTWPAGGSRDATVGRTAAGSAKIVANGSLQALTSASVAVVEGQLILLGAYAKWTGIVGSAGATLVLQCFSASTLLVEQEIAQFTPAGAGGWQELQATFVIPAACDNVKLLCEHTATSGTLWWDDVSVRKKIDDKVDEAQTTAGNASASAGAANSKANNIIDVLIGAASGGSAGANPLVDAWNSVLSLFGLADTAHSTATSSRLGILSWATGSSIGADPGVVGVMAEIRAAIASGATVVEYTSNATWTPPAGLIECFVILVGSGQSASASQGGSAGGNGGIGGEGGGFVAWKTNPDDIPPTVAITVGINGGTSKFGNLYESAPGSSGISNGLGFSATTSAPGKGGNGGKGGTSGGTVGGSSALGVGGTAGAIGSIGTNGGAGGDAPGVPTSTTTKSGAGGGGGGGAGNGVGSNGGKGGNGGFPGGGAGGGGGGGAVGSSGGASGNPGNGIVWLVFKATGS